MIPQGSKQAVIDDRDLASGRMLMSFRHAAVIRSRAVEMQCRHGEFVRYQMQLNPFQLGSSRFFLKHFKTCHGILILWIFGP